MMNRQELVMYTARLYERRHQGTIARQVRARIGEWMPCEYDCHANVTIWCQYNPHHKPVRGWLYIDFGILAPFVRFNAHSVIETEHGELIDITPSRGSQPYPFIRAEESEEEYAALISGQSIAYLDHHRR